MKKKIKLEGKPMNKKVQKIIFAAMALSAMVPAGIGLSAVVPFGGNTQVVEAAADQNDRFITIHKYDGKAKTDENGKHDTGQKLDPAPDKNALANIPFKVTKIVPKNGGKWSSVDPANENTYEADTTVPYAKTDKTSDGTIAGSEKGIVKFELGKDDKYNGYYLVEELDSESVQDKAAPFIVQVPTTIENEAALSNPTILYGVHVYPKNDLIDTNDDLHLNKLVDGKKFKGASAGQTIPWQLSVNIPKDIVQMKDSELPLSVAAPTFEIHDVVDPQLDTITTPVVKVGGTTLTAGTGTTSDYDYSVSTGNNKIAIVFTDYGKRNLAKLLKEGNQKITVDYKTNIAIDKPTTPPTPFESGRIDNVFSVKYTAPSGMPYDQALTPDNPNDPNKPNPDKGEDTTPATYTGGFDILKTDENKNPLAGAEFVILVGEKTVKKDGDKVILPNDAGYADSLPDYTVTTAADGTAKFVGLGLNDLDAKTGNVTSTFTLKEIKAPDKYSMTAKTENITVDLSTLNNGTPEATIVNEKKFILPLTGGNGYMVLIVIAAAAGIMLFVAKRKKDEEEEKTETK